MGKQIAQTYRGRCQSATKVRKDGQPKRAGNFSAATFRSQQLQSKDYRVTMKDGHLVVGTHTYLLEIMPLAVVQLAMEDQFLDTIVRKGTITRNGKEYECAKRLVAFHAKYSYMGDVRFLYREEIYTNGDFIYDFPEY